MKRTLTLDELVNIEENAENRTTTNRKHKKVDLDILDIPACSMKKKKDKKDNTGDFAAQDYSAYEKKIQWIENDVESTKEYKELCEDEKKQEEIAKGNEKKKVITGDYINKQNERYNQSLNKAYDKYTEDIKEALEH
ncbi:Pre-mRNA-splicing factor SYF2 [Entamoeba marina]